MANQHGQHERRRTASEWWAMVRASPFLPAIVLVLLVGAAAGLFAGSYTYALANPTPRYIPIAVVGSQQDAPMREFLAELQRAVDDSLDPHSYATVAAARWDVEEQQVFGVVTTRPGGLALEVSGASGQSVAQLLSEAAAGAGAAARVPVDVTDIVPLQRGDPRGLAIFYISLAAVIIGFIGATQFSVHAAALTPAERIGFTAAYSLVGGFAIAAIVDWVLGAVRLPFLASCGILSLTMFTSGMVFTMFNTLVGRWAILPTWGLMVLLGNPSSGGAVSWPLLPSLLGHIGRWLPPGASVNAQHTAVYFRAHQHLFPFLVLAGWAFVACAVFWIWRGRHPGGRSLVSAHTAGK
ncbi:membrane protein [Nocardia brasiliensis]|uniref:membrane protein n=1 Tax=Nocardia brasiliensis TaxID=37326 RepID=UPI0004A6EA47|nr:membrane protein [Nocardia brasiliensis]MBF6124490.1 ABC transporter permease [Nocardia brasiliensis]